MIDEKDQLISNLENEVRRLRAEKKKLEDTVQWMQDMIWQKVREREKQKDGEISSQTAQKLAAINTKKKDLREQPRRSLFYAIGFSKMRYTLSPSVSIKNGIPGFPSS